MLPDDVVRKAISNDLPRLQGRFEGFSDGVLQRLAKLERRVHKLEERPRECVGLLGKKFGHSFVQAFHPGTDRGHGVICNRCGYYVGSALTGEQVSS